MKRVLGLCLLGILAPAGMLRSQEVAPAVVLRSREAAERALPLLARASAGSADQRTCFTCHSQAMPVLAMVEAQRHGLAIDQENLDRQVEHAYAHLKRGQENYSQGRGQGGGVDTAGYALWTLEDGGRSPDEVTDAVVHYLLKSQQRSGHWKTSSRRPPSEASHFTTTYLALRALAAWGDDERAEQVEAAQQRARPWLESTQPKDTEDHVFRLLSLRYLTPDGELVESSREKLLSLQRSDGGWAQDDLLQTDAYATATALYALSESGMDVAANAYRRGAEFLISRQLPDGSWHVVSRSKPFQTYFETGFPHARDQYISTTASAWAAIALLRATPALALEAR